MGCRAGRAQGLWGRRLAPDPPAANTLLVSILARTCAAPSPGSSPHTAAFGAVVMERARHQEGCLLALPTHKVLTAS